MSATTTDVLKLTVTLSEDVGPHIFVTVKGELPIDNGPALGPTYTSGVAGDAVAVTVLGVAIAIADAAIGQGDLLKVTSKGKVAPRGASGRVVGRALTAASANEELEVLLIVN